MALLHLHVVAQPATRAHTKIIGKRTVCHVSFANIDGLSILATRVPEARWRSRVNIERYSACPYDVRLNYRGQSLRIDFSTAVTQDSIASESGTDVDAGFFTCDGEKWVSREQVVDSPDNMIRVRSNSRETMVTGTVELLSAPGQPANFCFSVALIRQQGLVIGTLCAPQRELVAQFSQLFSDARVMTTRP